MNESQENMKSSKNNNLRTIIGTMFMVVALVGFGLIIGVGIGEERAKGQEQIIEDKDLWVFVWPSGCGNLCENLSIETQSLATKNGYAFRQAKMDANITVPGTFILTQNDKVTQTVPFDSFANLKLLACNEFGIQNEC